MGLMYSFRKLFFPFHRKGNYYKKYRRVASMDLGRVGVYKALKEAVGAPAGGILDFGCGIGYVTHYLGAVGVDRNPEALATARRLFPGDQFEAKERLEDLDGWRRFGAVVCVNVIEHLQDDVRERFFSLVPKLLLPGGKLYIVYDNMYHPMQLVSGLMKPGMLLTDPTHVHCWTPRTFKKLLERSFQVEKFTPANIQALLPSFTNHFATAGLYICRPLVS